MKPTLHTILCVPILLACAPPPATAQEDDDPERTAVKMITPETERSIEQGLAWLADQQHDDGSFGLGQYRNNVGITGLAGLALMASGSTPGRGPYGEQVGRCVDYILANTRENGYIKGPKSSWSHGPMYGHGFATLFLAECYGMTKRPELREKLSKAVKLIIDSQNKEGGWRYYPDRREADTSVTVCQVMALRAARNAGLFVPKKTIDDCIDYVKQSQNPDGGFMYTLLEGRESEFGRSAAGVVALNSAGVYEGPELDKGIKYLMQFLPEEGVKRRMRYPYYGHYYAVQAMWLVGGDPWKQWYPAIRDELLRTQEDATGAWVSLFGNDYATAMALIILQIPENQLPIFQR